MNDKTPKTAKPNIHADTLESGQPCRVEFNRDITIAQYSRNSLEGSIDMATGVIAGELAGYKFLVSVHSHSVDVVVLK